MAIQPIDLQTLYSQLENVSKGVAAQQQGAQLHSVLQNENQTKKIQEKQNTVQETKNEQNADSIHERKQRKHDNNDNGDSNDNDKKSDDNKSQDNLPVQEVIRDPGLGRHIDICG